MEHHFYLPQIGLIFLISTWLEELLKRPKLFYVLLTIFLFLGAITVFRNSVWKDEVSLSWDMLAKNPNSLIGNYQIGLKYLKDGDYPRAILYLKRVLSLNPDDELKIKTIVLLAQAKFGMGEVEDALRILKEAIRKYPQSPPLYKELEKICLLNSELDLEKEIGDLSKNAVLLYHLGEYHYKRGDLEKAEFYLKEALSLSPWNSSVYYLLAAIYERKGTPDTAIRYYTRCVELDPFSKLANYNLGTLLAQRGDPSCIVYLKRAIRLDPTFAQAFYNLGLFYLQMGDSKKAFLYLAKANRLGYPISDDE
jgi:tetratricopeptide (TPR) repeat protein